MRTPEDQSAILAAFLREALALKEPEREALRQTFLRRFPDMEAELSSPGEGGDPLPPAKNAPGMLGPYRLLELLGRGGQGEVHLAFDTRLQRKVAVKVLRSVHAGSPDALARFHREAAIASRLDHPNICPVYDTGVQDGVPYIVMRYVAGTPLSQLAHIDRSSAVSGGGPLTLTDREAVKARLRRIVTIVERMASAVHAAHELSALHRDLKPQNVLLTEGDQPIILDFGVACWLHQDEGSPTLTGDLIGTPAYLAPELLADPRRRADRRTDVYALGVTLYECLVRRRPFDGPTREALYKAILEGAPTKPREEVREISGDLQTIVLTAMERNPERRYQSAHVMSEDLRRLMRNEPILARPPGLLRRSARFVKRHPAKAVAAVLLPLALASSSVLLLRMKDLKEQSRLRKEARIEALFVEAMTRFNDLEEKDLALSALQSIRELEPDSVEALAVQSLAQLQFGREEEALLTLDTAPDSSKDHPALKMIKDEIRRRRLRRDGMKEEDSELGTRAPDTEIEHYVAATILSFRGVHINHKDLLRACDLMQRCCLLAKTPRPIYHLGLLKIACAAQEVDVALRAMDTLAALWPAHRTLLASAAKTLADTAPEKSVTIFRSLLEAEPNNMRTAFLFGSSLLNAKDYENARPLLELADRANPENTSVLQSLIHLYRETGETRRAVEIAERRLKLAKTDLFMPRTDLGITLLADGQLERAIETLKTSVTEAPNYAAAWSNLGTAYSDRGDFEEALDASRRAAALEPFTWKFVANFGLAFAHLHRYEEAIEPLQKSLAMNPEFAELRNSLAVCQERAHRLRDALGTLEFLDAEWRKANGDSHPNLAQRIEELKTTLALSPLLNRIESGEDFPADSQDFERFLVLARAEGDAQRVCKAMGEKGVLPRMNIAALDSFAHLALHARRLSPGSVPIALAEAALALALDRMEQEAESSPTARKNHAKRLEAWKDDPEFVPIFAQGPEALTNEATASTGTKILKRITDLMQVWEE